MQANAFKRNAYRTINAKQTKTAFRALLARKTPVAFTAQAAIALQLETTGLLKAANPYLLGAQLNPEILAACADAMGGVFQQIAILSRTTKAKMPGSGKKVTLKGMTITEALLELDTLSAKLLTDIAEVFDGVEVDLGTAKARVEEIIELAYPLTYSLLKVTPGEVMDAQQAKLDDQFGEDYFEPKTV